MDQVNEPYTLVIDIPSLPKILTNSRGSWRAVHAQNRQWKGLIRQLVGYKLPTAPLTKATLICTRFSSRCPDFENLASSFKHCLDGLVEAGVLIDDSMKIIGAPDYRWVKARPKDGAIRIEVSEVA